MNETFFYAVVITENTEFGQIPNVKMYSPYGFVWFGSPVITVTDMNRCDFIIIILFCYRYVLCGQYTRQLFETFDGCVTPIKPMQYAVIDYYYYLAITRGIP